MVQILHRVATITRGVLTSSGYFYLHLCERRSNDSDKWRLVAKFQRRGALIFIESPARHVVRLSLFLFFSFFSSPTAWQLGRNNFNSPRQLGNLLKQDPIVFKERSCSRAMPTDSFPRFSFPPTIDVSTVPWASVFTFSRDVELYCGSSPSLPPSDEIRLRRVSRKRKRRTALCFTGYVEYTKRVYQVLGPISSERVWGNSCEIEHSTFSPCLSFFATF